MIKHCIFTKDETWKNGSIVNGADGKKYVVIDPVPVKAGWNTDGTRGAWLNVEQVST